MAQGLIWQEHMETPFLKIKFEKKFFTVNTQMILQDILKGITHLICKISSSGNWVIAEGTILLTKKSLNYFKKPFK